MKSLILVASAIIAYQLSMAQHVGIGTPAPIMKLHIASPDSGQLLIENSRSPAVPGEQTNIYFRAAGYYVGEVGTTVLVNDSRLSFYTGADQSAANLKERLTIMQRGNVGIGNTSPSASFEVARGQGVATAAFEGTARSSYFNYGADEVTSISGGKANSPVLINAESTGGVYLSQGGGGVNIGGSLVPPASLYVVRGTGANGTAQLNGTTNASYFNFGDDEVTILNGGKANSQMYINPSSTGGIFMSQFGGGVCIGIATPIIPPTSLYVARGTGASGTAQFAGTTNSSHFNYGSDEATFIRGGKIASQVVINDVSTGNVRLAEGGGNVGIGVTIPSAKLEVNGQVKINGGSPVAGAVLTSDATGLAKWAAPVFRKDNNANGAAIPLNSGAVYLNFANNPVSIGGITKSGSIYTIGAAGLYQINIHLSFSNFVSASSVNIAFYQNNGLLDAISSQVNSVYADLSYSNVYYFNAGDKIQFLAGANSLSTAISIYNGVTSSISFSLLR